MFKEHKIHTRIARENIEVDCDGITDLGFK